MSGLNLGIMGGARVAAGGSGYSSTPSPSTATQAAYGPASSGQTMNSTKRALTPNDAFGAAFWTGVISLGLLALIRHSLPA